MLHLNLLLICVLCVDMCKMNMLPTLLFWLQKKQKKGKLGWSGPDRMSRQFLS